MASSPCRTLSRTRGRTRRTGLDEAEASRRAEPTCRPPTGRGGRRPLTRAKVSHALAKRWIGRDRSRWRELVDIERSAAARQRGTIV